ncbi:chitin deacetylase 8-like [Oratosquilla oratoria]|uniref:chitin deacetylase 8-like n=1 Tax=Oratosquilla oratoria TaxID=337810 RepID=UPI003F772E52
MRVSFHAVTLLVGVLGMCSAEKTCEQGVNCLLPNCMCPTTKLDLPIRRTPQLVILSFDDAVTITNYDFYQELSGMQNPNGCNISMTFFVSHQYNNYSLMYDLYRHGHEIALHSVTHKPDIEHYWRPANYSVWKQEMEDLRTMVTRYGLVSRNEDLGWRAPFLEIGGDEMFRALYDQYALYDCSWTSLKYSGWYVSPNDSKTLPPLFPYTLDHNTEFQDCQIGKCPKNDYRGLWVFPMVDLQDGRGEPCAMLDTCQGNKNDAGIHSFCDENNVYDFLMKNFNNRYHSNRAPFGLYSHYSWFKENDCPDPDNDAHRKGYKRFLDEVNGMHDVYIVSIRKALEWFKEQVSINDLDYFEPFLCNAFPPKNHCLDPLDCIYEDVLGLNEIRFNTCHRPCPANYPWLGNPLGE